MSDDLIVDTGSSNLWVGANSSKPYVETSSSKSTGETMVGLLYLYDTVSDAHVSQEYPVWLWTSQWEGIH